MSCRLEGEKVELSICCWRKMVFVNVSNEDGGVLAVVCDCDGDMCYNAWDKMEVLVM